MTRFGALYTTNMHAALAAAAPSYLAKSVIAMIVRPLMRGAPPTD